MGKRLLKLPRRLFGYQASSVDQLIADRESMLGAAEQRVRSAEARIADLQEELSRRDEDIEAVKARLERANDSGPAAPPAASEEGEEVEGGEHERAQASRTWNSPEPSVPPPSIPMALDEGDDDEADEVEEWPVPTIRPRTVEFIPPPEPSADFDPMPIGGEDHEWTTPAVTSAWAPEDERATAESATHVDPWSTVEQRLDEPPTAVQEVPAPAFEEYPEPAHEERLPQLTPAYVSEELAHVVKAAEESATKIIERAWESTRSQIEQIDRLWREVQEEIIRFAAWREHVDPMIATVQSYIEEARASIEQVPPRIQEALSPAVEAMARVDMGMSEFARASDLPQLLGKLHAEVAKTVDAGNLSAPSSESMATDQELDPPTELPEVDEVEVGPETPEPSRVEEHEELGSLEVGTNHHAPANGGPRAHAGEDMDMARAIAHELRIVNESGDPITSPDKT